jgi:hypothetical protein
MAKLTIACVYKTGGDFDSEYVEVLYAKLGEQYDFVCLTDSKDVPSYVPQTPLQFGWKGWWSKMELFNPEMLRGDILYLDLDTVIVGDEIEDIDEMYDVCDSSNRMIMLSDFYYPDKVASGIMYIPYEIKKIFWDEFMVSPHGIMNNTRGDQDFLMDVIERNGVVVDRWNDLLPNYIASYKVHVIKDYPRHLKPLRVNIEHSKIICYHGKPRPKSTNWSYKF